MRSGIIGERRREHLQRDVALERRVDGPVDLAHATFANPGHDFVRAMSGRAATGMAAMLIPRAPRLLFRAPR